MKIDAATISQNPIVIDEILISAPTVVYEINRSGLSNVDVLKKNLASGGSGSAASTSGNGGEEFKMIIRKLDCRGVNSESAYCGPWRQAADSKLTAHCYDEYRQKIRWCYGYGSSTAAIIKTAG